MTTKSADPGRWWSIPQAIVWIVSRSETDADSARHLSFLANLPPLRLIPSSPDDEPPISLSIAPEQFLQAARAGQIAVFGWERGKGKPVRVPLGELGDPKLDTREDGIAIMDRSWPAIYWSNLAIHADECMRRWPAPKLAPTANSTERPTPHASDNEMLNWMVNHQCSLKGAGREHGRDIVLKAAREEFNARHKVVSDIWNSTESRKRRLSK
jgi:hypothetical protein